MADYLVDTNVLIVGSAAIEPRYEDVKIEEDEVEQVFQWLMEFRDDPEHKLVMDDVWKIYEEYNHKLNGQHFGLQVIHHKMQSCMRIEPVRYDEDGYGIVPPALAAVDNSDKKFVAAALNDPQHIQIVNATDSDWRQHAEALEGHGVSVLELLS